MSIRTSPWSSGVPCWVDLAVPDVAAATAFYGAVLGWSFTEPSAEYGGYTIGEVRGAAAAGIGPAQPGASPAWTLYLASDDVDKTAAAVAEHGGTVLLPPADVGPLGRWFLAVDPTGAPFGGWAAGTRIGAGVFNEPGGITWEDLRSPDPESARAFYTAVFGYHTDPVPGAPADYTTFALPGGPGPLGGIGGMMESDGAAAHWLVYFGVADTDAAVAAAERAGGSVLGRHADTTYGRMAGLTDPDGATFWVVQTTGETAHGG